MNNKDNPTYIPYIAHESIMARMERANRRLWITCFVLMFLLFISNMAWTYYESQFVDTTNTTKSLNIESDSGDPVGILGDGNEVNNGIESDNNENSN